MYMGFLSPGDTCLCRRVRGDYPAESGLTRCLGKNRDGAAQWSVMTFARQIGFLRYSASISIMPPGWEIYPKVTACPLLKCRFRIGPG
jgi:hypothetical protein